MQDGRTIRMRSVANLRDLGGIFTADGLTLRPGLFYRSAALNRLTEKDAEMLSSRYAVRRVIDLRTERERDEKPDRPVPGAETKHLPVFTGETFGISHEQDADLKEALDGLPELGALYRKMVSDPACAAAFKEIFKELLSEKEGAVLFHCTGGKDRAGIVSALLLTLLGVPYHTVKEDYLLSNSKLGGSARRAAALVFLATRSRKTARRVKALYRADETCLAAAFDEIGSRYGGFDAFRRDALGISDDALAAFRARVLTNPAQRDFTL